MLVRSRLSRIFYRRTLLRLPAQAQLQDAPATSALGYARRSAAELHRRSRLAPRSPEETLEDFLVNRFGDKLYRTFFKDYTEKVWGVPCSEISAEWGAQRIKGLSITKALKHALPGPLRSVSDTRQKGTETSLIERFLYPKYGPGQMWEEVDASASASGRRGAPAPARHRLHRQRPSGRRGVDVRDVATGAVTAHRLRLPRLDDAGEEARRAAAA